MRINKKAQYGVLLCLYIARAGRATIPEASANLKLSTPFLEQIARKLRIAGILTSVRGVKGGYEMPGEPTIAQILKALSPASILTPEENRDYTRGEPEHRALAMFARRLTLGVSHFTKGSIRAISEELVNVELERMDDIHPESWAN